MKFGSDFFLRHRNAVDALKNVKPYSLSPEVRNAVRGALKCEIEALKYLELIFLNSQFKIY